MTKPRAIVIIPARYASKRLPGKPIVDINGKPLIRHVYENMKRTDSVDEVVVATDDAKIADAVAQFDGNVIFTSEEHPSGTDRVYEAFKKIDDEFDIIVNVQGDEPLLKAESVDMLIKNTFESDADAGTLIKQIYSSEEIFDPSVVKVALGKNDRAVYFSRSPVPFRRDTDKKDWIEHKYWKHIGIYAYKPNAIKRFSQLEESELEKAEKLEQLRLMEDGAEYLCCEIDYELLGVDTKEDVEKVKKYL